MQSPQIAQLTDRHLSIGSIPTTQLEIALATEVGRVTAWPVVAVSAGRTRVAHQAIAVALVVLGRLAATRMFPMFEPEIVPHFVSHNIIDFVWIALVDEDRLTDDDWPYYGVSIGRFLSPKFNQRGDEYGGSLENRLRLTRELFASAPFDPYRGEELAPGADAADDDALDAFVRANRDQNRAVSEVE